MTSDVAVLQYLNHMIGTSPQWFYYALKLSDRLPWLLYALALCSMWYAGAPGLLPERPKGLLRNHARDLTLMTCLAMPLLFVLSRLIQFFVPSLRPMQQAGLLEIPIPPKAWQQVISSFHMQGSFPSDHAVVFFLLVTVVFAFSRWWGMVAFALAVFFSMLRVALGFHWPSDVLVGAGLGIVSGLTIIVASRWLDPLFTRISRKKLPLWLIASLVYVFLYDCSYKFSGIMSLLHQASS